jgi:hypothetical protein
MIGGSSDDHSDDLSSPLPSRAESVVHGTRPTPPIVRRRPHTPLGQFPAVVSRRIQEGILGLAGQRSLLCASRLRPQGSPTNRNMASGLPCRRLPPRSTGCMNSEVPLCHHPCKMQRPRCCSRTLEPNAATWLESSRDWVKQNYGGPFCPRDGRSSDSSST